MFFSKIIGFQRKSWIETHIKSHILVIMEQKSRASFEPVLSNEDPLKKQRVTFFHFFLILTDFSSILIKNNMKYPKNPFFDENWVQNDFSTISGSEDVNTMFLADHVTFLKPT